METMCLCVWGFAPQLGQLIRLPNAWLCAKLGQLLRDKPWKRALLSKTVGHAAIWPRGGNTFFECAPAEVFSW